MAQSTWYIWYKKKIRIPLLSIIFIFEVKMSTTFLSQFIPRLIFNSSLNCKSVRSLTLSHIQIIKRGKGKKYSQTTAYTNTQNFSGRVINGMAAIILTITTAKVCWYRVISSSFYERGQNMPWYLIQTTNSRKTTVSFTERFLEIDLGLSTCEKGKQYFW